MTIHPKTYEPTPSRKVAFLGLGVMGYPMATHLALAGHQVTVYNRTATKSIAWKADFAEAGRQKHAGTPALVVADAEFVFCCVGNDEDLRSVVLGNDLGDGTRSADGAFAGMKPGAHRHVRRRCSGIRSRPTRGHGLFARLHFAG